LAGRIVSSWIDHRLDAGIDDRRGEPLRRRISSMDSEPRNSLVYRSLQRAGNRAIVQRVQFAERHE
jgi:hypothetical protein